MESLTFEELRKVNVQRAIRWHGPEGLKEWSVSDWACAVAGEVGEMCNAVKKFNRLKMGIKSANNPIDIDTSIAQIAQEIGDAAIYLDLISQRLGLKLEQCIQDTFNRVSLRENYPERL